MEPDVFVMPFGIKEAEAARQAVEQKKLNLFPNKQKNAQNCRDPFTNRSKRQSILQRRLPQRRMSRMSLEIAHAICALVNRAKNNSGPGSRPDLAKCAASFERR
jgi:hypothetical protein